jgi:peptide/nickel transport system substrate-binding protein
MFIFLILSSLLFQGGNTRFLVYSSDYASSYLQDNLNSGSSPVISVQQIPQSLRFLDTVGVGFSFDSIKDYVGTLNSFIFDSLVFYDFNTGELVPHLANQWVVTNDSKQWIFSLRQDVIFHDGSKFNSSVVKFNFDRFTDPNHPAYVLDPVPEIDMPLESVDILGEYKVAFNFLDPYPIFINVQAPYIDIISSNSFQGANIISAIGTGPYKYLGLESNITYHKLVRNNNYFLGTPPFETVEYLRLEQEEDLNIKVVNEDVNFVSWVKPNQFDLDDQDWIYVTSEYISRFELGWFNHLKPPLHNARVREAINYAIDKEAIIEAERTEELPLTSILPHTIIYHDETIPGYPYDVTHANALLAEYPRTEDGYRFTLNLVGHDSRWEQLYTLASYLDEIGINTHVSPIGDWFNRFMNRDYDIFILGWTGIIDPAIMTELFLHSTGFANTGGYSNAEMDHFINLARQTPIRQEHGYYYSQIQQLAQQDAPYLLLTEELVTNLMQSQFVPFINMTKNGRVRLNYIKDDLSSSQFEVQSLKQNSILQETNTGIKHHTGVEISNKPIYFPFTDAVIDTHGQRLIVNMSMSQKSESFLPATADSGKFVSINVNDNTIDYTIRLYYDTEELTTRSSVKRPVVSQWDENQSTWITLTNNTFDTSLQYVEVNLKGGDTLLRLTESVIKLTFVYLPGVALVSILMITIASIIIWNNSKYLKLLKKEHDLV